MLLQGLQRLGVGCAMEDTAPTAPTAQVPSEGGLDGRAQGLRKSSDSVLSAPHTHPFVLKVFPENPNKR